MEAITDREKLERELREAIASDGLKEPNQACDASIQLTNALPRCAGGRSKDGRFFQTEKLLSYLSDEREVSKQAVKQNISTGLRRKSAEGDDADARRLVSSILAQNNVELRATSSEECCADLVEELAGDYSLKAKPWVGSSSDKASNMDKVKQKLFNSVRKRLPRLIAEKVRSMASKDAIAVGQPSSAPSLENQYDQLARSLEKRVATTVRLDAEDASCFVELAKVEEKFKAYTAMAGQLLDQNTRLRRIAAAEKMHASHLEDVARGLSVVHDSLASRLEQCSSLIAATTSSTLDEKIPQRAGADAADLAATDHKSAFDEICTEVLRTAIARSEVVGKMEDEQEGIEKLSEDLSAELIQACQGSVTTWCMGQESRIKPDDTRAVIRKLFREFHEDPERFLKRVRSAEKRAGGYT